ncbi:MAG: O-antigen ligase family protein, partial [Gemmatimonadetes bacterium]|nr:O-antigen ligase family protein [Gemmatimonadota bacterium]
GALALYAAYLTLTALWAVEPAVAIREGVQFFSLVFIFVVVENVFSTMESFKRAVVAFCVGAAILVLGSLASHLTVPLLPTLRISPGGGTIYFQHEYFHVVTVAMIAGSLSMICTALLLGERYTGERRLALTLLLVTSVALQGLLFKRIELLALGAGGTVLLFYYGWRRLLSYWAMGGLVAVLSLVLAPTVLDKFQAMGDMEEGSAKWHLVIWPRVGYEIWKENPLLGKGGGAFETQAGKVVNRLHLVGWHLSEEQRYQAHNIIVKMAADSGLVGVAIFAWFLYEVFRFAWRGCGRARGPATTGEHLCRALLAASVLELIVSLGQNPHQWGVFWLVFAMAHRVGTLNLERKRDDLRSAYFPGPPGGPRPPAPALHPAHALPPAAWSRRSARLDLLRQR